MIRCWRPVAGKRLLGVAAFETGLHVFNLEDGASDDAPRFVRCGLHPPPPLVAASGKLRSQLVPIVHGTWRTAAFAHDRPSSLTSAPTSMRTWRCRWCATADNRCRVTARLTMLRSLTGLEQPCARHFDSTRRCQSIGRVRMACAGRTTRWRRCPALCRHIVPCCCVATAWCRFSTPLTPGRRSCKR